MLCFVLFYSYSIPVHGLLANSTLYDENWNEFLRNQSVLIDNLFREYKQDAAPVNTISKRSSEPVASRPANYNQSHPVHRRFNYTVQLFSFKLVGVVEPEERVTVIMEVSEQWYDPRLTWDPDQYGGIFNLHVRQTKVWSPTLTSFGATELIDLRDQDFRMAGISNEGTVYTFVSVLFSTNCAMKVGRFPFDTQTCQIRFCMTIFYARQVQILSDIYSGIQNESAWKRMGNSEWDLVNLTHRVELMAFGDDDGDVELAVFEVKLKRNPMYYIYMIVFPSFIINFLSIIGVFMRNSDTMSKLNVGLTNIMTMTFILGVMSDKIPRTGSIPLLGVYIIINLGIMIVAVGITFGMKEFKKYAVGKLKSEKNKLNRNLVYILGDPLETVCIVFLETLTIGNFLMMIVFWISDE